MFLGIAEREDLCSPSRRRVRLAPSLVELDELLNGLPVLAAWYRAGRAELLFCRQEVRFGLRVAALAGQAGAVPAFGPGGVMRSDRSRGCREDRYALLQSGFRLIE